MSKRVPKIRVNFFIYTPLSLEFKNIAFSNQEEIINCFLFTCITPLCHYFNSHSSHIPYPTSHTYFYLETSALNIGTSIQFRIIPTELRIINLYPFNRHFNTGLVQRRPSGTDNLCLYTSSRIPYNILQMLTLSSQSYNREHFTNLTLYFKCASGYLFKYFILA